MRIIHRHDAAELVFCFQLGHVLRDLVLDASRGVVTNAQVTHQLQRVASIVCQRAMSRGQRYLPGTRMAGQAI